jgi:protein-S-isoprenylcysteine O-methyltransferase Ste14
MKDEEWNERSSLWNIKSGETGLSGHEPPGPSSRPPNVIMVLSFVLLGVVVIATFFLFVVRLRHPSLLPTITVIGNGKGGIHLLPAILSYGGVWDICLHQCNDTHNGLLSFYK